MCLKSLPQNHSSKVLHCWKEPIIILRNIIIHRSDDAIWMRNEDDNIKKQTWVLRLRCWWWFEMKSNLNIILSRITLNYMFNRLSNCLHSYSNSCCILVISTRNKHIQSWDQYWCFNQNVDHSLIFYPLCFPISASFTAFLWFEHTS